MFPISYESTETRGRTPETSSIAIPQRVFNTHSNQQREKMKQPAAQPLSAREMVDTHLDRSENNNAAEGFVQRGPEKYNERIKQRTSCSSHQSTLITWNYNRQRISTVRQPGQQASRKYKNNQRSETKACYWECNLIEDNSYPCFT